MAACDRRVGRVFEAHAGRDATGRAIPAWASKTRPTLRRWTIRFTKEDVMTRKTVWTVLLSALLVAGCSQAPDAPPTKSATAAPAADGTKYVLANEPADAKGVKDLRAAAKDGDD